MLIYVLSTLFHREGYWAFCQHRYLHMSLQYLSLSENRSGNLCQNLQDHDFLRTACFSLDHCQRYCITAFGTIVMRYSSFLKALNGTSKAALNCSHGRLLSMLAFCGKANAEELPPLTTVQLDLRSWSDGE
jgi:hypothetical protein